MTTADDLPEVLSRVPRRADARRNYEKLLVAAREAFARHGASASLEDIARTAGVGIGTLYRHFPTRQDLFEAVYVREVQELCAAVEEVTDLEPWDALAEWLKRFVVFITAKRAFAEELAHDGETVRVSRAAIYAAGGPLMERAQEAGAARRDMTLDDALRLLSGIGLTEFPEPGQVERVTAIALDGFRRQP